MKKWMKAMTTLLVLCMSFCLLGSVGVKADEDDENVYRMVVEYDGDPVQYEQAIDPDDFDVKIYYRVNGVSKTRYLDSSEFTISPTTMESQRYEKVSVTYESADETFTARVTVECAKPDLVYIEAEYTGDDLIVGGDIDEDDVRVEAFYSDGSSSYVSDWYFESYRLREGYNDITISYKENGIKESDEITVEAFDGELSYITAYYSGGTVAVGGKVNNSYVKVTGVYTGTSYGKVSQTLTGWYLDSYSIRQGNNTITVIYREDGKNYTDTITVQGSSSVSTTTPSTTTGTGSWIKVGSAWKYRVNNVYQCNTWVQAAENGKWYWLDANGNMVVNKWVQIDGKWYWLEADGTMATGWKMVDSKWYYLNNVNGDMYTGWLQYKGCWYYMMPGSGEMAKNVWVGNWYVNGDGIWSQTR